MALAVMFFKPAHMEPRLESSLASKEFAEGFVAVASFKLETRWAR